MIQTYHSPDGDSRVPAKLGIQFNISKKSLKRSSMLVRKLKKKKLSNSSINSQSVHSNSDKFLNTNFQFVHPQRKPQILKYLEHEIDGKDIKISSPHKSKNFISKVKHFSEINKSTEKQKSVQNQTPQAFKPNLDFTYIKNYGTQDNIQTRKTFYSSCFPLFVPSSRYPAFIPRSHKQKKTDIFHSSQMNRKSDFSKTKQTNNEELPYARMSSYQAFPNRKKKHGVQVLVNMLIKHVRNEEKQKHIKQLQQIQEQQNKRKELIRGKSQTFGKNNKAQNYLFTKIYFKNRKKNALQHPQ